MPEATMKPNPTALARKLARRIETSGPISFHDYMEACLYDPDYGYYRKRGAIGSAGDFITAPEISQVFGELIGLWAGEVWRSMGAPETLRFIELGPGRGTLMADSLRALRILPRFLECATTHLIETSEPLRHAQQIALAGTGAACSWHQHLKEVPEGSSILIANEFFDCLPVQQFMYDSTAGQWKERSVTFVDGTFSCVAGPVARSLPSSAEELAPADGDILEQRPGIDDALRNFAERARCFPFAALIVDYGYARPSLGDTVQAVKEHRFAGIFEAPGETDLTAHVDFARLRAQATDTGFETFGPMPMGEWLLRLGLEARARQLLARVSDDEARHTISRVSRLVDPAQMGALFKVLALTKGISAPPPPF